MMKISNLLNPIEEGEEEIEEANVTLVKDSLDTLACISTYQLNEENRKRILEIIKRKQK